MRFIRVTENNEICFINVAHVVSVEEYDDSVATAMDWWNGKQPSGKKNQVCITTVDGADFDVDQSLQEVMSQIEGISL